MAAISATMSSTNKSQAEGTSCEWYSLLNLQGKGKFVDIMEECIKKNDFTEIDNAIKKELPGYLYKNGNGKMIPASEIVRVRECIRNSADIADVGHKYPAPPHPVKANKVGQQNVVVVEAGETISKKDESQRLVCWDLAKRGTLGETLLHLCLLQVKREEECENKKDTMKELAKRILKIFPKLFVDIYLSDEYFGENILHIAIANEVEDLVEKILDLDEEGTSLKERAFGVAFSCDDQVKKRLDLPGRELIQMPQTEDYQGLMYFGEYPLSFAACVGNERILNLLKPKLESKNYVAQDHNGNTVLHLLVIRDDKEMYDFVLSMIPKEVENVSTLRNNKGYTPVTLAAAIGRKDMYNHLTQKKRQISWVYGDVTCADYPLDDLDSIGSKGEINTKSALHLIINGKKPEHLEMTDSMIENLLTHKWERLKLHFYQQLMLFCVYFTIITAATALRPGRDPYIGTSIYEQDETGSYTATNETREHHNCYMFGPPKGISYTAEDIARLVLEALTLLGVFSYIAQGIHNLYTNGWLCFRHALMMSPTQVMFVVSWLGVLMMMISRAFCTLHPNIAFFENVVADVTMMLTAPRFLYFCRGFKFSGPLVTMISKMLVKDFLPFLFIYSVFMVGFSQAMYVVHIEYSPADNSTTLFRNPGESIMGMFYMSMGEFISFYDALEDTKHEYLGKTLFVFHMLLVTLLLINMLIAMMGNTYTAVNETQKEWLRQWATVVLITEQTLSPEERLQQQKSYAVSTKDDKLVMPFRWHHTDEEIIEEKETREQRKKKHEAIIREKSSRGIEPKSVILRSAHGRPEES